MCLKFFQQLVIAGLLTHIGSVSMHLTGHRPGNGAVLIKSVTDKRFTFPALCAQAFE